MHSTPRQLSGFITELADCCLDIHSVWWLMQSEQRPPVAWHLLAFADAASLAHLRKANDLYRADIELLVVTDGDRFESVWGNRTSGSLGSWSWRRGDGPAEAFYSEARWDEAKAGGVVRVRRKAIRVWQSLDDVAASAPRPMALAMQR